MTMTQLDGPLIVSGQLQQAGSYNPDLGTSLFFAGTGIYDMRNPYDYGTGNGSVNVSGWSCGDVMALDYAPSAASTTAIAAAQVAVSGTKLTLVSTTGSGITILSAAQQVWSSGNTIAAGTLAIDGPAGIVQQGQSGQIAIYDPTKAGARNVQIASVGNDSSGYFTVSGYDVYGYPMTEKITGANASTATGKKAFKYITSIVPGGTMSGSNVSAGQGNVYGMPLRVDSFAYAYIVWAGNTITASTNFTAADATSPATNVTGDTRGTFTQTGANGTNLLQIFITPKVANLTSYVGMTGVTPA